MKQILIIIILSIFFASGICKAQTAKYHINICNITDSLIHISEISKFTDVGCDRIIYTDAAGNILRLSKYVIAFSPKQGYAYFEHVNGEKITQSIKERIEKLKPGDIFILTYINDAEKKAQSSNATKTYKIVD